MSDWTEGYDDLMKILEGKGIVPADDVATKYLIRDAFEVVGLEPGGIVRASESCDSEDCDCDCHGIG